MKKHITELLLAVFCVIFAFGFSSCETYVENISKAETSVVDDGDPFTFESVDELKIAIKKEPKYYSNKQVTVKGTAIAYDDSFLLADLSISGVGLMEEFYARQNSITVIIPDDILCSVLETGDYIKIAGTVNISNGEIYLDNCTYTMIITANEREQNEKGGT